MPEKRVGEGRVEMALVFLHRPCWLTSLSRRSRTTGTVATQLAGRVQQGSEGEEEEEEEGEEEGVIRERAFLLL